MLAGATCTAQLPQLPDARIALATAALALAAAGVLRRRLWASLPALVLAGAAWAAWHASHALEQQLPEALQGVDLVLEGRIADLPKAGLRSTRFAFAVERAWRGSELIAPPRRVLLSWYAPVPALGAGERWRLTVRLKRPRGLVNPGGFDYERYLLSQRIAGTGYVRAPGLRLAPAPAGLVRLRAGIGQRLQHSAGSDAPGTIVRALAVGDASGIPAGTWELLRATGTTHLISVSGLHVGLLGGLAFWAVRRLWSRSARALRRVPAPVVGAVAGAIAATGYAALAGFAVPAQRAALMFSLAMLALALRREVPVVRLLAVALLGVLAWDPLAPLAPGMWLSFGAVGAILYLLGGRPGEQGRWRSLLQLQLGLGLLLLAPTLGFFGLLAPAGLAANLLAVPWVSFIATPLALLAAGLSGLPWLGPALGTLAAHSVAAMLVVLEQCAAWLPAVTVATRPTGMLALAGLGTVLLVAPRGWPARGAGLACLLPAMIYQPPAPRPGELWLTTLDVGQGLAVVVRTAGHSLVYDTGPELGAALDAGNAALLPALRSFGVRRVDAVVLSHADSDHVGGYASLLRGIPVTTVWSGAPARIPALRPVAGCTAGQAWTWDRVRFEFLHPLPGGENRGNASSCVLRVEAQGGAALLTGDIGEREELAIIGRGLVPAQVLIAPHHGSRHSSSAALVRAVRPGDVVFSASYRSQFGHPHPLIVARYGAAGAHCWSTARDGAVALRLTPDDVHGTAQREAERRFWRPAPQARAGKCA